MDTPNPRDGSLSWPNHFNEQKKMQDRTCICAQTQMTVTI
jgi:hypothetical protein